MLKLGNQANMGDCAAWAGLGAGASHPGPRGERAAAGSKVLYFGWDSQLQCHNIIDGLLSRKLIGAHAAT